MKNQGKHVHEQQQHNGQHGVHMQMTTTQDVTNSEMESQTQTTEKIQ